MHKSYNNKQNVAHKSFHRCFLAYFCSSPECDTALALEQMADISCQCNRSTSMQQCITMHIDSLHRALMQLEFCFVLVSTVTSNAFVCVLCPKCSLHSSIFMAINKLLLCVCIWATNPPCGYRFNCSEIYIGMVYGKWQMLERPCTLVLCTQSQAAFYECIIVSQESYSVESSSEVPLSCWFSIVLKHWYNEYWSHMWAKWCKYIINAAMDLWHVVFCVIKAIFAEKTVANERILRLCQAFL